MPLALVSRSPSGDPADLDATGLSAAFAAGSLSPEEVLDACIARIGQLNPTLNAIVALDADGARAMAQASAARWQDSRPAHGPRAMDHPELLQ